MRIVCISDTHGKHNKLVLPEGDMILHAGDFSSKGRPKEVRAFFRWFSDLPYRHKIVIAGNHDFLAENEPEYFRSLIPDNCHYLEDSGVTVEGIRIWGSPITPWFFDWAFNRKRGAEIRPYWEKIPEQTDILLTHGPPMGILDRTARGMQVGCEDLKAILPHINPAVHLFGHIHEAYGTQSVGGTLFVNASVLNLLYQLMHFPVLLEWKDGKATEMEKS